MARRDYDPYAWRPDAAQGSVMSRYSEDEWNALPEGERRTLSTVGGQFAQSELSPELQQLYQEVRRQELKGDIYKSLAAQGAQLAAGGLMYLSPQDRASRERIREIEAMRASGDYLGEQRELMEREGMGQAAALASEERMRAESLGASAAPGVEAIREARRLAGDRAFQAASAAGGNIARANLEAAGRMATELAQQKAYQSQALRERVLEPLAQGAGEGAALLGAVRGAAPGKDIMGAFDLMRNEMIPDPDDPSGQRMMRAFSDEEIAQTYRYLSQLSPERQREHLEELERSRGVSLGLSRPIETPTAEETAGREEETPAEETPAETMTEEQVLTQLKGKDTSLETIVHGAEDKVEVALDFRDWMNENHSSVADQLDLESRSEVAAARGGQGYSEGIIIGTSQNSSMRRAWAHEIEGETAGNLFLTSEYMAAQTPQGE